jgi:amino acid permease
MLKKTIFISLFLAISLLLLSPFLVSATTTDTGLVPFSDTNCPAGYTGNCGDYSLNDLIVLVVKVSRWILGIVGSLTLVMFTYGGFTFLISAGSSEKVGEARKIIAAAVVGLLIVLSSFLIIKFVLGAMGIANWNGQLLTTNEKGQVISPKVVAEKKVVAKSTPTKTTITADACQKAKGTDYNCININNGHNFKQCFTGLCPGLSNIQCCGDPIKIP